MVGKVLAYIVVALLEIHLWTIVDTMQQYNNATMQQCNTATLQQCNNIHLCTMVDTMQHMVVGT